MLACHRPTTFRLHNHILLIKHLQLQQQLVCDNDIGMLINNFNDTNRFPSNPFFEEVTDSTNNNDLNTSKNPNSNSQNYHGNTIINANISSVFAPRAFSYSLHSNLLPSFNRPHSFPFNQTEMSFYKDLLMAVGDPLSNDPSSGKRKPSCRESSGALKAWLVGHRNNPYPTKSEKVMLALLTRMTLTQVSTWFANARRRLKKEKTSRRCCHRDGKGGEVGESEEEEVKFDGADSDDAESVGDKSSKNVEMAFARSSPGRLQRPSFPHLHLRHLHHQSSYDENCSKNSFKGNPNEHYNVSSSISPPSSNFYSQETSADKASRRPMEGIWSIRDIIGK